MQPALSTHKKPDDHEAAEKHHHKAAQFRDQNQVSVAKTSCKSAAAPSFGRLGIPTRLSAYGLGADAIDVVVRRLDEHGITKLSERGEVTLTVSRQILEAAL